MTYSFRIMGGTADQTVNWLIENNMLDNITYDWNKNIISFLKKEDATVYSLKFGARMLNDASDY